jgi:hypothetical protein
MKRSAYIACRTIHLVYQCRVETGSSEADKKCLRSSMHILLLSSSKAWACDGSLYHLTNLTAISCRLSSCDSTQALQLCSGTLIPVRKRVPGPFFIRNRIYVMYYNNLCLCLDLFTCLMWILFTCGLSFCLVASMRKINCLRIKRPCYSSSFATRDIYVLFKDRRLFPIHTYVEKPLLNYHQMSHKVFFSKRFLKGLC